MTTQKQEAQAGTLLVRDEAARLFQAGATLRAVLAQFEIPKQALVVRSGHTQGYVSLVLKGGKHARRVGLDNARAILRVGARLLGVRPQIMPDWKALEDNGGAS